MKKNQFAASIAKRFFHVDEIKLVVSNIHYFSRIWTVKESYVKNIGIGINSDYSKFCVVNFRKKITNLNKYHFYSFYVNDYVIAICTYFPEYEISIISLDDMINHMFTST